MPLPNLLIGLSNIGDVVMTTAVLEAMHVQHPGTEIDVVGDRRSSEIYAAAPFVRRVIHKDKRSWLRGVPGLVRELRSERYDLVVDLRTEFLPLLLRAERRALRWRGRPQGRHAVEQHLGVLVPFCPAAAASVPRLHPSAEHHARARALLGEWYGRRLLALGPGANWAPKIWPPDRYARLLSLLHGDFDAVVILGSELDRELGTAILCAGFLPGIDACGRTGLMEAAATLAQASMFIGSDSGLGHMAAAMDVPTVTLFGPGDPGRYRPFGPRASWIEGPAGNLPALAVERVAEQVVESLRRESRAGPGGAEVA